MGNRVALAFALAAEGRALAAAGRTDEAVAPFEEAIATSRAAGSLWPVVDALPFLAKLAPGGEEGAEGREHLHEAARTAARLGARIRLGEVCTAAGVPVPG